MKNIYIACLACIVLAFSSCTVEKRHYMSGYHVEWNSRNKQVEPLVKEDQAIVTEENNHPIAAATAEVVPPASPVPAPVDEPSVAPETVTASVQETPAISKKQAVKMMREAVAAYEDQPTAAENKQPVADHQDTPAISHTHEPNVDDVLLVILCIFIPPLAVYLYEDDLTTNFWIDLILCLLFWLPGMIYAFLVCFGGVSLD